MKYDFPKEIDVISSLLNKSSYKAYLVGGCVRDLILGKKPKDWDIATNAKPQEVQKLFPKSVYENDFGTVGVKTGSKDETLKIVEITTFRKEGKYSDARHPDEVKFAQTIEEDLSRRDFTINAMALELAKSESSKITDPFDGLKDLDNKVNRITDEMKLNAAHALASVVKDVKADKIVPDVFDKSVVKVVANSIK